LVIGIALKFIRTAMSGTLYASPSLGKDLVILPGIFFCVVDSSHRGGNKVRKNLLFTLALLALVSSAALAAKMPTGSFLKTSVSGPAQLTTQVTDVAIVATRYAKHFGTSRNVVVDFFKNNIKIARLKSDFKTNVYSISGRTDIIVTTKVLPAGTYVFVDKSGRPILEASTGNPLTRHLGVLAQVSMSAESASAIVSDGVQVIPDVAPTPGSNPATAPETRAAALDTSAPTVLSNADAIAETLPEIEVVSAIPAGGAAAAAISASSLSGILPLAAVLGGAALAGAGGGTSRAPVSTPVSEPTSIMALAMGGSVFAFSLRRRVLKR
jgi:hypothetical protein